MAAIIDPLRAACLTCGAPAGDDCKGFGTCASRGRAVMGDSDIQPDPYIDAMTVEHHQEYEAEDDGDLVAFLTARLDEDEAAAKAALGIEWDWRDIAHPFGERPSIAHTVHIARHDPARELREVEAGRHLIADYVAVTKDAPPDRYLPTGELEPAWVQVECLRRELARRAAVYSDHPGYAPDWSTA